MSDLDVLDVAKTVGTGDISAVLRGVSFYVPAGDCIGLKGATGAGKTTLLRLIAGLEKPDAGEIRMDGLLVSSSRVNVAPSKRRVGFVFQSLGLWPHLTVSGHLDYVLAASSLRRDEAGRRKIELMEALHLRDLAGRRPGELSGGEKHLLAIARALANDARILLMDEPFAGLDGYLKDMVISALRRILRERGLTTLLVSHDEEDLRVLCRGVIQLREGHVKNAFGWSSGYSKESTGSQDPDYFDDGRA